MTAVCWGLPTLGVTELSLRPIYATVQYLYWLEQIEIIYHLRGDVIQFYSANKTVLLLRRYHGVFISWLWKKTVVALLCIKHFYKCSDHYRLYLYKIGFCKISLRGKTTNCCLLTSWVGSLNESRKKTGPWWY